MRTWEKYKPGLIIKVNDKMQRVYSYVLIARYGRDFAKDFKPFYTPQKILKMGAFEGKYLNDCRKEFPKEWFKNGKFSPGKADPSLNYFRIKSRQSLREWRRKNWILKPDVRGWFQWYCRYYIGRRIPKIDRIQINRWKAFKRHVGQIKANCKAKNIKCRPKQRQALLQWAYNPFI